MFSLNSLLPLNCLNLLSQAISNCELILEKGEVFNTAFVSPQGCLLSFSPCKVFIFSQKPEEKVEGNGLV